MSKTVKAGPTKAFFVEMLIRDIDLEDAILDLLDNSVDGVVRDLKSIGADSNALPFSGYEVSISANPNEFVIEDNCGGIPQEIAINSAFMLGRPDLSRDDDIETVGMYGIGMKRAIFKLGKSCAVLSDPRGENPYEVVITPEWMEADDWELSLDEDTTGGLDDFGTRITVSELRDSIRRQFDQGKSTFIKELHRRISEHYALILEKGFSVKLNGVEVKPANLGVLSPDELGVIDGPAIEPYVFVGDFEDVHVEMAVGFYRPLATEQELDDEIKVRSSRESAGWTVICNNRVVLYNDKSAKTGWGTAGVPGYHNQFIAISGVVSFTSNNSLNLPLNTTKRGIDTSADVYPIILDYMRDGLKKFTSFTNDWKKREDETSEAFQNLQTQRSISVPRTVKPEKFTEIRKRSGKMKGNYYSPNLPKPEDKRTTKRISFTAEESDISIVAEYYFGTSDVQRNEVGEHCFNEALEYAKEAQE